jgi:uncharacterized phage protein (TIGR01671 family)
MREIKFRAWDGKRMTDDFVVWNGHATDIDEFGFYTQLDWPLMQHTGLKDRNGVEVYEGDIVRGPSNSAVVLETSAKSNRQIMAEFEVRWAPNQFWGSFVLQPLTKVHRTYPAFSNCEVIGNIYQNPELLK